jgi:hypothetical protein
MFFPPLGVHVMVSLVPVGESIRDKRQEHAMLLVDAVEERTDMTVRPENTPGELGRLCEGFHFITFDTIEPVMARRNG